MMRERNATAKAIFLDVGGVILTNGWDRESRKKAAEMFQIDYEEMNRRHALTFDTYEIGKISLDEYIKRVVFFKSRSFSIEQFKEFMFAQSQAYPDMMQFIRNFKKQHELKVVTLSNEGRELTEHRIHKFKLKEFVDIFVFSAFVHLRKPDTEIYRIALDVSQFKPHEVIYIDDRPMLVEIANQLGMKGIQHTSVESTQKILNEMYS